MDADAELFRITFKAKQMTQLSEVLQISSRYTAAEAYNQSTDNGQYNLLQVGLRFGDTVDASSVFALKQNSPNPFRDETVIGFVLPEATTTILTIYDVSGREIKQVKGSYEAGYHEVSLNRAELTGGVLYYQLVTPDHSATKRMMLINK